jgi:phosphate-selective porin OprO and OprP
MPLSCGKKQGRLLPTLSKPAFIDMPDLLRVSALAVCVLLIGTNVSPAHAFRVTTEGGPKIRTEGGNFELGLNARAHLDVHWFSQDRADARFPPFGSQVSGGEEGSGFNWRRTYTTLTGRFYRLNFKFENDFAAGAFPHTLRETWISTKLGSGLVTFGQFKPYRGMEELTSSNEITFMERPSTSSTGIYNGRQFLMGMGYRNTIGDKFGYGVDVMSLAHVGLPMEGVTYGGRAIWLPIADENTTMHFAFAFSRDHATAESLTAGAVDVYGGRMGVHKSLGTAGAGMGPSGQATQTTFAGEAAYAMGPLTLQGEYANSRLDNSHLVAGAQKDSTVQAYYIQASWFVTGERALYRKDRGTFGKPKPISKWGALELAVRYDVAENVTQSLTADPCRTATSKCQVEVITLGANWYVRPGLRFMLNYYVTDASIGNASPGAVNRKDEPFTVSFRTQLSF